MMIGQKSEWQEIRLDFFKEEVLSRFLEAPRKDYGANNRSSVYACPYCRRT